MSTMTRTAAVVRAETNSGVSLEIQFLKGVVDCLAKYELEQNRQAAELARMSGEIDTLYALLEGMRETVVYRPDSWRKDAVLTLQRVARARHCCLADVFYEAYALVDQRAGVSLKLRLRNRRRRMTENGACWTKVKRANKIDAIEDDKKLIEIFFSVVKEMAVECGLTLA